MIIEHHLNISLSSPDLTKVEELRARSTFDIREEVDKLLETSIVMIKNSNDKQRICSDHINLNRAYPLYLGSTNWIMPL